MLRFNKNSALCACAVLLLAPSASLAMEAQCIMDGTVGSGSVTGTINLYQDAEGEDLVISGAMLGAADGWHGFHVHEFGDLGSDCVDAGGHFNPGGSNHGAPNAIVRHVGDWGNVLSQSETIVLGQIDTWSSLFEGPNYIGNLAIVLHEGEDDLGYGGDDGSLANGNAGSRLSCCIIEMIGN